MVGHNERQKLLRDLHHELAWGVGVALKCTACLLILAGIAAIGVLEYRQPGAPVSAQAQSGSTGQQRASLVAAKNAVYEGSAPRVDGAKGLPDAVREEPSRPLAEARAVE